jgi:hypothetical protein
MRYKALLAKDKGSGEKVCVFGAMFYLLLKLSPRSLLPIRHSELKTFSLFLALSHDSTRDNCVRETIVCQSVLSAPLNGIFL